MHEVASIMKDQHENSSGKSMVSIIINRLDFVSDRQRVLSDKFSSGLGCGSNNYDGSLGFFYSREWSGDPTAKGFTLLTNVKAFRMRRNFYWFFVSAEMVISKIMDNIQCDPETLDLTTNKR
jgi:hypothetical protein